MILLWVGLATWRSSQVDANRSDTAKIGQRAPEITLRLLENGQFGQSRSLSEYQGKPVMINFWATWCPPCRDEFPAIEAKYRQYKDTQGLVVMGIDSQGDAGPGNAQQFIDRTGVSFPIWIADNPATEDRYQVDSLPTTVFIDRAGVIQDIVVGGPMTPEQIDKELGKILP
ncbi:MAG: TlpA disulfide reductase family protein [Anaerolineae bacterium]